MPQPSACRRWATQARAFLAAVLLVLAGDSSVPLPAMAAELYLANFDPLSDLPLPPAWHDTPGFATTVEALWDQIASQSKASVRVDPRLPAVESDRLDEDQQAQWAQDRAAAQQALLDSLPDGSFWSIEAQPGVNQPIQAGAGPAAADAQLAEVVDLETAPAFDAPDAASPSTPAVRSSSLTLEVGETALEALMASELVAKVQARSLNTHLAAGDSHSLFIADEGSLWA